MRPEAAAMLSVAVMCVSDAAAFSSRGTAASRTPGWASSVMYRGGASKLNPNGMWLLLYTPGTCAAEPDEPMLK